MPDEFFKISSGLKNLIGSELITDNFVAVFELVKNSFDANATIVNITFENIYSKNAKIIIKDNGKGMDYDDLLNKWLFVAYSAKKDGTEEFDYRNKIKSTRLYAGAKGVGRFSCDRLGRYLNLISIKKKSGAKVENLFIDWKKFEENPKDQFIQIPVEHKELKENPYKLKHGTVLEITGINSEEWNRDELIKLKDRLSKLVRPDLNTSINDNPFKIYLCAEGEIEEDRSKAKKFEERGEGYIYRNTVNGEIKNFVFEELNIKTTKITTEIAADGNSTTTSLNDRENFIYSVKEKNKYLLLKNISIKLYFLNRSAKNIFKRRLGVDAVEFGNVFVYKNGFRIYPFGERGNDILGIDNRAVQGYNRYIGLRNLIGVIEIDGNETDLKETTSRDGGLVKTKAYNQLMEFLFETLRRLEKYVIDVTEWGVNDDSLENLDEDEVKKRLVKLISNISDDKSILGLEYNKNLIQIISEQEENSAKKLVSNFKRIAAETNNPKLLVDSKRIEKAITASIKRAASAEKEALTKDAENKIIQAELEQQITETLFAKADRGTEKDDLLSIQHHIFRHSAQHITNYIEQLVSSINKDASKEELLRIASKISFENKKIITLSRFVTKAQFDTTVSKITADLIKFVNEYVLNVYQEYKHLLMNHQSLKITASAPANLKFDFSFRPIEIIIILDNLLNNAFKAKAKNVKLEWESLNNSEVILHVKDDGVGISDKYVSDIFNARFTTTNGSGLGLYHTKEVIEKMGGAITVNNQLKQGAEFILKFKK